MARNIELLTKVRDLLQARPDKLDMSSWGTVAEDIVRFDNGQTAKVSCGTTACIAGWAVQLHGYQLLVDGKRDRFEDDVFIVNSCVARNGRVMDIEDKALELLGLTQSEGNFLFLDVDNAEAIDVLNQFIANQPLGEIQKYLWGDEDD